MTDYSVDRFQEQQQADAKQPFPAEIAPIVAEISALFYLYEAKGGKDVFLNTLAAYVAELKSEDILRSLESREEAGKDDFLKSWQDIIDLQVYVDSDIYGKLDPNYAPPKVARPNQVVQLSEFDPALKTIAHDDATASYVKSWTEIAERLTSLPDDIFSRSWSTKELAKFLGCSSSRLRRARKSNHLPLQIGDFVVDCISATKNKLVWGIRPK